MGLYLFPVSLQLSNDVGCVLTIHDGRFTRPIYHSLGCGNRLLTTERVVCIGE